MVDTTDIEKKSLEAHVELCAERYKALDQQLNDVKHDTKELKEMMVSTHSLVHQMSDKRNDQIVNWGIGIIGTLVATIAWFISHYIAV